MNLIQIIAKSLDRHVPTHRAESWAFVTLKPKPDTIPKIPILHNHILCRLNSQNFNVEAYSLKSKNIFPLRVSEYISPKPSLLT